MILIQTRNKNEMFGIYRDTDLFLTTTNSTLHNNEILVMGAGHAKQVSDFFKVDIKTPLANAIKSRVAEKVKLGDYDKAYVKKNRDYIYNSYGLIVSDNWPKSKLGIFQTKYHYKDLPDYDIINYSTQMLLKWCEVNNQSRVDMPFVGIGLGKLERNKVYDILEKLPDTVYIWKLVK